MAKCKHDELENKMIDAVVHVLKTKKEAQSVDYEMTCANCDKKLSIRVDISRYVGKQVTDWESVDEF